MLSCSCNEGYSGPACMPVSTISELREEFSQNPLNSSLWSFVSGNAENASSQCGRLTGGNNFTVVCICKFIIPVTL